jgi:hypothetical protein
MRCVASVHTPMPIAGFRAPIAGLRGPSDGRTALPRATTHLWHCARVPTALPGKVDCSGRLPLRRRLLFRCQRFFIAMDSAFRQASVSPPFLTGTGASAGAALGVTAAATGAGAAAAALAALIRTERFFAPAMIARLPAALNFRFAGAVVPTLAGGFEPVSTTAVTPFDQNPTFSLLIGP